MDFHQVSGIPSRSRSCGRAFAAACLLLALARPARAHDVFPTQITLRPGGQDFILVVDPLGCEATITATSLGPSIVTLCALDMAPPHGALSGCGGASVTVPDRVDQVFVVTANPAITTPVSTVINICWVGRTAPNPPCPENNCTPFLPHQVVITVDPDAETSAAKAFSGLARDPVDTHSGELVLSERPDFDLGGPFDLVFRRSYASRLDTEANSTANLGLNWRHNFDWKLFVTGNDVEVVTDGGRVIRFERGVFGSAFKLALYEDVAFRLVASGGGFILGDPRTGASYVFDALGRLTRVDDNKGNSHALTYTGSLLTQISDGLGRTLTLTYASSLLTNVSDGTRNVQLGYTGGQLTSATDALGKTTLYGYGPRGLLTARTLPEGNTPYAQTFDASRRVDTQTDALGHVSTFAYDTATRETTIVDPLLGQRIHTHNAKGALSRFEDEAAKAATFTNDSKRRRSSATDRLGRTTSWTYHAASGLIDSITEADGAKTNFGYTARSVGSLTFFDLTSLGRADGRTERFAYDASGNLVTWTDAAGNDWTYTHDARGQVLTATNPSGGVDTFTYNADGTLATAQDDAGNTTTIGYDALRRPNLITHADLSTEVVGYDALDRVTSHQDELGNSASFVYDDNGNLTSLTDALTHTWTFAYDALDRLESVTDPLGHTSTAAFDELGRTETVTDANGDSLTLGYDARGRLVSGEDDLGNVWAQAFDDEGVLRSRTNPLGKTLTLRSDALGRTTRATSPLGHAVNIGYDALGRVATIRDPKGEVTAITYGKLGLPASISIPGAKSTLTRSPLGQISQAATPGGNVRQFGHDAQGRRTSDTDALGNQRTYQYDNRDRPSHVVFPAALGTLDVTYDACGRTLEQLYSDGTVIDYGYDAAGQLTSATGMSATYDSAGRLSDSNGLAIGRDLAGRVTSITLAPGKTVTYAWDARDRLLSVTDWVGGVSTFTCDAAGRATSLTRPNGLVTTWSYDDDDRLVGVQDGVLASIVLARDARGDVKSAVRTGPLAATPPLQTRALAFNAAGEVSTFSYDALGRLLSDGTRTCAWNLASRLASYVEAGNTVTFARDAAGMPISRTEAAVTRTFVWNYALDLPSISVVRQGGSDVRYYVHTPGGLLLHAIEADDTRHFFHFDEQGSTQFLTDDAGGITDSYAYSPYGVQLAANGSTENPFTWLGQLGVMREGTGGLYAMRERIYDSATARFLSRDPLLALDPRGGNPYAYAHGNPLRYVDPQGTSPVEQRSSQVLLRARLIAVEDGFLNELGVDVRALGGPLPGAEGGGATAMLTQEQVATIVRTLQRDDTSIVLSSPAVTTACGQSAGVLGTAQIDFVADLDRSVASRFFSTDPESGLVQGGGRLQLTPRIELQPVSIVMDVRPQWSPFSVSFDPPPIPESLTQTIVKFRVTAFIARRWLARELLRRSLVLMPWAAQLAVPSAEPVIGGLLQANSGKATDKVPLLGDIPLVGGLFRSKSKTAEQTSLQIFITPRIIKGEE